MARVTIEDSLKHCPNIFWLIQLASQRAHQLQHGATPKVSNTRTETHIPDAAPVLALREIAAGHIDFTNEIIPEKDAFGHMVPTKLRGPKFLEDDYDEVE